MSEHLNVSIDDKLLYHDYTTLHAVTELPDEAGSYGTDIASYIFNYGPFIVWPFGTIGNILSFVVFSHKEFKHTLTGFLFRWLAVFDFIVVQEHIERPLMFAGVDPLGLSLWACGITFWLVFSFQIIAAWMLVAIAVERLIAVQWPHQAKSLCTVKRGKIYVGILVLSALFIMFPTVWSMIILPFYDTALGRTVSYCIFSSNNDFINFFISYLRPWLVFLLYAVVPFCVLIGSNITIIVYMHRALKKRKSQGANVAIKQKPFASINIMLICVSITFVILTTPLALYFIDGMQITELWAVGYVLQALNHSINFVLYCLSGRPFRRVFINMVTGRSNKVIHHDTVQTIETAASSKVPTCALQNNAGHTPPVED